jgi:glycerol dehydrogenase
MLTISAPRQYLSKPNALEGIGSLVRIYARCVFILGGSSALAAIRPRLFPRLDDAGVKYEVMEYSGRPTGEIIAAVAEKAGALGAEAVVAAGGGRVIDTAKAAANKIGLQKITIPTIAATCAAWASLSVIYNAQGAVVDIPLFEESPVLVVADTGVLANAPVRYLNAGISDTVAKWYELLPELNFSQDFYLKMRLAQGDFMREVLETDGLALSAQIKRLQQEEAGADITAKIDMEKFAAVVDSIILLAGLSGSIRSAGNDVSTGGLAHALYYALADFPETSGRLHGEKVAFGMLVQAALEKNMNDEYLQRELRIFAALDQPLTLKALGFDTSAAGLKDTIYSLAEKIKTDHSYYRIANNVYSIDEIYEAIMTVDRKGVEYLNRH